MFAAIRVRAEHLKHTMAYVGRGNWCPVCRRHARRFAPYGASKRPNAGCPWCGAAERHRFLWLLLAERFDVESWSEESGPRLLHIAPERAFQGPLRDRLGPRYASVDLSSPLADVHADLTAEMPFGNAEFDLVICSHVLEHIPDDRAAMEELFRITKPGGATLVMVPIAEGAQTVEDPAADEEERIRRFGQADHVRLYGMDVAERLRGVGFLVESVSPLDFVPRSTISAAGLSDRGAVFVSRRPA